ncbi:MAG: DUF4418 family protein [Lachnospiraceae bacterium]|nr:DUF4418 family protein [Lachnospiraceae bacterium]
MKNRVIISATQLLLGVLVYLIPTSLFAVCKGEMKMACYYTKQAEIGLAIIVILLSIASLIFADKKIRAGISISLSSVAIIILLYPLKLIGLCKMDTMPCRIGTLPARIVVSFLLFAVSAANAVYLLKKKGEGNE